MLEEIVKTILDESDISVSEIYEKIKLESTDYRKLEDNINRCTRQIKFNDPQRGKDLEIALITKARNEMSGVPLKDTRKVLYLCDGMVPECRKTRCYYKNPAENPCKHTSDINHAVNFKDFMEQELKDTGRSSNIMVEQEKVQEASGKRGEK